MFSDDGNKVQSDYVVPNEFQKNANFQLANNGNNEKTNLINDE